MVIYQAGQAGHTRTLYGGGIDLVLAVPIHSLLATAARQSDAHT